METYEARGGVWPPDEVRALRRRLGVSQQGLAGLLGVRQQTVSDWETGLHAPQGASRRLLGLLAGGAAAPVPLPDLPSPEEGVGYSGGGLLRAAEARAPYDAPGESEPHSPQEQGQGGK